MKLFKNWYWKRWYILIEAPKMKALGGAFWPIMRVQDKDDKATIKHEESHLKTALSLLLLLWGVLYLLLWLLYGYNNNPFERHARAVETGLKWKFLGWFAYL